MKYLRQILRHKWYVFLECVHLGIPFLGIIHDLSKFLPSEFFPYARWFYGKRLELAKAIVDEAAPYRFGQCIHYDGEAYAVAAKSDYYLGLVPWEWKEAFDVAWLHHQKRNKHHWQYWHLYQDDDPDRVLPMPDKYRREMLADWRGAGRAYAGEDNTLEWYTGRREKMEQVLHPETRRWIESQLSYAHIRRKKADDQRDTS